MTGRSFQAPAVAAAAALIGGLAMVVVPQHALTIVQLVVVTAAVAAALHVIVSASGTGGGAGRSERTYDRWARLTSPFRRMRLPEAPRPEPPELERTRNYLDGQRLVFGRDTRSGPVDAALAPLPPVPTEVVRRLARILRASLNHLGLDPAAPAHQGVLQANLSPLSWAVLSADQVRQSRETPRDRRVRPRYLPPDAVQVSQVVHAVLDDVDRLQNGGLQPAQAAPAIHISPQRPQIQSPRGSR